MPKALPLTQLRITAAIAEQKKTKKLKVLYDGGRSGLFLKIKPNGSTLWQYKYTFNKTPLQISLGPYPYVSLAQARDKWHEERSKLENGVNPSADRKKDREVKSGSHLFKAIAEAWVDREVKLEEGTIKKHRYRLNKYVYPYVGDKPIADITTQDLLQLLRRIELQKKHDTAKRVHQMLSAIWAEATIEEKCAGDVASPLKKYVRGAKKKSHAAIIVPRKLGRLLRDIDGYEGSPLTCAALKLLSMLFVRPGELRNMEWSELDLKAGTWRIPPDKMKMDDHHVVPLSKQAVEVLEGLKLYSGDGQYVFPGREGKPVVSENTFNKALRNMGYDHNTHVSHGFRTTARTLLGELEYDHEAIELQLAHKRRGVNASYNQATKMELRTKMMQEWSDYLDNLRVTAELA